MIRVVKKIGEPNHGRWPAAIAAGALKALLRVGPADSGVPVAQEAKRRPTDLAIPDSNPTAFHYHPAIVLIWLKYMYCWKGQKVASHASILRR